MSSKESKKKKNEKESKEPLNEPMELLNEPMEPLNEPMEPLKQSKESLKESENQSIKKDVKMKRKSELTDENENSKTSKTCNKRKKVKKVSKEPVKESENQSMKKEESKNDVKKKKFKKMSKEPGKESENQIMKKEESKNDVNKRPSSLKRCPNCRQQLDSNYLKMYPGDPQNAEEEFAVLTNPLLSLFTDGSYEDDDVTDRPQHKITNFCVYDCNTHICPFDTGLIEQNVDLYFSGVVKPIYTEDPSISGGVAGRNLGPIVEWYVSGYDGGEQALIGFSTAFAEYILMNPSEHYSSYMDAIKEKIYISKAVIELLVEDDEATYEDLLNKLDTTVPPQGSAAFTEELLLHYAQFVIDQIQSFDSVAEDDDPILIISPCIKTLMELSGVTLDKKQSFKSPVQSRVKREHKIVHSLAATTPLVRSIFENFFHEQLEKDASKHSAFRRKRCGVCEPCQLPDCGKCNSCHDMVKFGGSGRSKQACEQRRCPNMAEQEANEDTLEDEIGQEAQLCKASRKAKSHEVEIEWVGNPTTKDSSRTYYKKARIQDFFVECGDYILVSPADSTIPMYVAKLISMWQYEEGFYYHALWFDRGSETVLGETSNPIEVFGTFECVDEDMTSIFSTCKVAYKYPKDNWCYLGGTQKSVEDMNFSLTDDGKTFFYQKWYDSETGRFEDPPPDHLLCTDELFQCIACKKKEEIEKSKYVELEILEDKDDCIHFSSGEWLGYNIKIGDCVFINPEVCTFEYKTASRTSSKVNKVDEEKYPEAYRKNLYIKGSNLDTPEPFKIGYITKIFQKKKENSMPEVTINIFYRPENTHRSNDFNYQLNLNLLFWSNEEVNVEFAEIQGKCHVVYSGNLIETIEEFTEKGPYRFYFNEAYNGKKQTFEEPPAIARRIGSIGKGKGKKSAMKTAIKIPVDEDSHKFLYPSIQHKLKTLDVFAGCGGFTKGLHQSGLCDTLWAIENEESAAQAFRLNFPRCTVFSEDCNHLLKVIMEGKEFYKGQELPQKGDVELLCGGPPCQGFSGMNRFNSRQYSSFKNSLIVSYLSYCDYFRPKYFIMENVRNFFSFKRNMVLKLTLSCLIQMGYQCTFGVLQAGSYGVPQTRRRAIILAAAPGQKLPLFPEPSHVFSARSCQLSVAIDGRKYDSNIQWLTSAPYRTITVLDCISDLPEIKNGARVGEIPYCDEPRCDYQRKLRGKEFQQILKDHICKEMSPLVEARMRHIPLTAGADWRDLPNIVLELSDGTFTNKLEYTHHDAKNGKAKNGSLRGVCQCATGKKCDPINRQFNTLIPWCLPHTGNRHNHWAGLYGRLEWDGYFSTTITNPEPMGKQGRVLHPEQHRVVSVRECARSQGLSDTFRFHGNILDRHRQIGNAVPPPLAAAVGREILKCMCT